MSNHNAFQIQAQTFADIYEFTIESVFLWTNPVDRIVSEALFSAVFIAGATAVHNSGMVFAQEFFNTFDNYKVTSIFLDPSSLPMLLNALPEKFKAYEKQLKIIMFGGSLITEKHKQQMRELLPKTKLLVGYGTTETTAAVTAYEFSLHKNKVNCIGKPHSFVNILLLDDNGNVKTNASKDNLGIIACESPCLMSGYWKDAELTSSVLSNGRLILADMGYFDDEGFLYIAGRKDDVITTGGYKVAPYEIEDVVMQIPDIAECVCVAAQNEILGSVPQLFVVMKQNSEFIAKDIINYLSERLEAYKLPRAIKQLDKLPRVGETQKIDRKKLVGDLYSK